MSFPADLNTSPESQAIVIAVMSRRSILGGEHWTNVPFSNFCLRFRRSVPTLNTDQVESFCTQTKYWQYIIMFYAGARENIIVPVTKAYTVDQSTMPKRTHVIRLYKSKIEYNWSLKCTHSRKRKTSNITTGKFCFVITREQITHSFVVP